MGCGATRTLPETHTEEQQHASPSKVYTNLRGGAVARSETHEASRPEVRSKEGSMVSKEPRLNGLRILELNDFEQLDELDATPMSTVFRLRHRRSGLTVAGKRIRKGCEVHHSGDYLNEVKMLQKLGRAPYVLRLHGVCDGGEHFWTVLELCGGGRLEPWLRRCPSTGHTLLPQLLEAVRHLHGRLIVHLDLKPDNVLLSGSGEVRLCDFVTACELQDEKQQMMGKCGTPHFRAPEVEQGGTYNGLKADIYSLGRTLEVAERLAEPWAALREAIEHMTREPELRPSVQDVLNFLRGGAPLGFGHLESVPCDRVEGLRMACGSVYCQRLGACLCHDRVPWAAALMRPQERRDRLRRTKTP